MNALANARRAALSTPVGSLRFADLPPLTFDPRPVPVDPRALIPSPTPAQILADVEALAAELDQVEDLDPPAVVVVSGSGPESR